MASQPDTAPNGGLHAANLACHRGERIVFQNLAFTVEPSGALILTGANGSGKSSLLRVLAGLLPLADGTISWKGRDITVDMDRHRGRVAYLGHLDAVKPALTVRANLRFWARLYGKAPRNRIRDALERFDIAHLDKLPARFLSQGQRRRLNLARLLMMPSRIWLLDEPAVGLDTGSRANLEGEMARHRGAGGLVIVATHQDLAMRDAATLDLAASQNAGQNGDAEAAAVQ